jgi:hypothetical protein
MVYEANKPVTDLHKIRIYPCGNVVHEDDFSEYEWANCAHFDDYEEKTVTGDELEEMDVC